MSRMSAPSPKREPPLVVARELLYMVLLCVLLYLARCLRSDE